MRVLHPIGRVVAICLLFSGAGAIAETIIPIHTLEAGSPHSSYLGQSVTTTGIVVGVTSVGFYLEAKQTDWNSPLTTASEGIFIYTGSVPPAAARAGNEVKVTGTLQVYPATAVGALTQGTEIRTNVTVTLLTAGNPANMPPPIALTPADTPTNGGFTAMLRYQGMRVTGEFVVMQPTGGTINEVTGVTASNGIFYAAVNNLYSHPGDPAYREAGISVTEPSLPAGAPAGVPRWDGNPEVMEFDSVSAASVPLDVVAGEILVSGTEIGAVDFQAGRPTIMLENNGGVYVIPAPGNVATKTASEIGIGTLNLQRLYSPLSTGASSGVAVSQTAYAMRLKKLSAYIRNEMFVPEILAVQEVSTPTANPMQTLSDLATQINTDAVTAGQTNPQYVAFILASTDPVGGLANGFLYNPNKIRYLSCGGADPNITINNPPGKIFDRNWACFFFGVMRPGYPDYNIELENVEMQDRTNEDGVTSTGANVRLRRQLQAQWVSQTMINLQGLGLHAIALGDMNAFEFSDGYTDLVGTLKGTPTSSTQVVQGVIQGEIPYFPPTPPYIDLLLPSDRYTYAENGASEMLDHVLVSPELASIMRLTHAKGNAYYPVTFFNNASNDQRASDHDGLVAYLDLPTASASPAITVTANPEPSNYKADFIVHFTVTPPTGSTQVPTGDVSDTLDGAVAGLCTLVPDTGVSASCDITYPGSAAIPAGNHPIVGAYSGDSNYAVKFSDSYMHTILPLASSNVHLAITAGGNPVTTVTTGTSVTLTATVTGVTQGTVNFCDASASHCTDIHLLGTAQITPAGTATMRFVPGIGTHSYKAVFIATATAATGTSANVPLTVTGTSPTTWTLIASGSPGNYTLTETITGSTAIPPTGTISFQDTTNSNAVLGTASLVAGTSTFSVTNAPAPAAGLKPYCITSGDFNKDGNLDLAVSNEGNGFTLSTVTILLGNGDGTFTAAPVSPATGVSPFQIVATDLNGDGNLDLAVASFGSSGVFNGVVLPGAITILLGNGDGTFTPMPDILTGHPAGIGAGDFNGDGIVDLVVADNYNGAIQLLLGNGDGTFTLGTTLHSGNSSSPEMVVTGDFNNDGNLDFTVGTLNSVDLVYFGAGDGTFPTSTNLIVADGLASGDFNEDGNLDLALTGFYANTVDIALNKGNGTFNTPSVLMNASSFGAGVGDFNGDGHADLAISDFTNNNAHFLLGSGSGSFTASPSVPSTGASPTQIAIGDFNGDGLADTAITNFQDNNVTILLSQVTTTATATLTGVAITGSGTHWVDAVYPGDSTYTGSTSNPAPLIAQSTPAITLATIPEPSEYGANFTFTATVTPSLTTVDVPSGTITFSIDGTTVAAPVTMVAGVASYTIPVPNTYAIGVHTLRAVYSGDTNFTGSTQTGSHTVSLIATTTTYAYGMAPCSVTTPTTPPVYYNQDFFGCAQAFNTDTANPNLPSGFIDFTIDGVLNCTLSLSVSIPCTGPNPDAGTHQLGATYRGDATHRPSTSGTAPLVVLPDITATTVASSNNPAYQSQPVTFTAQVTGNYAQPNGVVSFYDGATLLGTGTLTPGPSGLLYSTATYTTSALAVGLHEITASYGATLNFLASVSMPALPQTIQPSIAVPSVLTLASLPPSAAFGQTVSFTAAVSVVPGTLPPLPPGVATGTVSFYDGATLLGTSNADNTGTATFNTATLAVGSHVITAQYAGDIFYLPAASNALIEMIHVPYTGPADFTLTVAQNPFVVGVGLLSATQVTVTATNGWTNDVKLACPADLPYETTCTLLQTTIAGGNGSTTLTMTTIAPHSCGSSTPYFTGTASLMRFGSAMMAGLVLFMLPRKRRVLKGLLLALLCVLPGVVGCAGNCTDLGTRPGTYTIPITATGVGTSTTHTVNVQMQVNL